MRFSSCFRNLLKLIITFSCDFVQFFVELVIIIIMGVRACGACSKERHTLCPYARACVPACLQAMSLHYTVFCVAPGTMKAVTHKCVVIFESNKIVWLNTNSKSFSLIPSRLSPLPPAENSSFVTALITLSLFIWFIFVNRQPHIRNECMTPRLCDADAALTFSTISRTKTDDSKTKRTKLLVCFVLEQWLVGYSVLGSVWQWHAAHLHLIYYIKIYI